MWRGIAGFASIMLLGLVGCATGVGDPTPPPDHDKKVCYPGHRPPSTISIVVYVDSAGAVQVVPERAVVENATQTVVWTAADGEISDIVFEPSECAPGPPSINRRGKQLSTNFGTGYSGTHKYSFTFHASDGRSIPVDPLVVIEY